MSVMVTVPCGGFVVETPPALSIVHVVAVHVGIEEDHALQTVADSISHTAAPLTTPLHRRTVAALRVNPSLHENVAVGALAPAE